MGMWRTDFSLLDRYLAQDEVREALGVGDRPWQSCSPDVYNDFLGKFLLPQCLTSLACPRQMGEFDVS